ncbi:MAG: hypothetical protein HYX56_00005 [Chloroflexi bacterium]|nr:hypothetical protein [Chloroflexota bacterium]
MTESPLVIAGAIAGGVALVTFVVVHAIWIVPIWGMLMMLPVAALVGAVAAWPFTEMSARGILPPAPLDAIFFSFVLLATLVPTEIFAIVNGPIDRYHIDIALLLLALALAAPAGAMLGLALTGTFTGAIALGAAALLLSLTLGHNLPFFPLGSPSWEKALSLVVVSELAAGIAFSVSRTVLSAGALAELR